MTRVRVGVLGYGVIGKRVADAIRLQPDMQVVGVAGRGSSPSLAIARKLGYPVFISAPDPANATEPIDAAGAFVDLMADVDVLLDCTPSGVPKHYQALYDAHPNLPIIVQGGEKPSFGVSFNSFTNYDQARGHKRVRVISCSSTGSTRMVWALHRAFGLRQAFLSLWRRSADSGKSSKNPIDALSPSLGQSHHAPDVLTVLPGLKLYSLSADCPTTLGHVLTLQADLERPVSRDDVVSLLERIPRVIVGAGLRSTADLADYYGDLGRPRRDRPEIYVWSEGLDVRGRTLVASFSVHMESITIPETVDCVRATLGLEPEAWASVQQTDLALGIVKEGAFYPPFLS